MGSFRLFGLLMIVAVPLAATPSQWLIKIPTGKNSLNGIVAAKLRVLRVVGRYNRYALVESEKSDLPLLFPSQPNYRYAPQSDDPYLSSSWALQNDGQKDGDGQRGTPGVDIGGSFDGDSTHQPLVAVLDSGVDLKHPEFVGRVWTNMAEKPGNGIDDDENGYVDDWNGWNTVQGSPDIQDDNNHGTLVAGIVGARARNGEGSRGVMDSLSMMIVKCTDKYGIGSTASGIEAIEYAVLNGARILNLSWGGTAYDPALFETIVWARERGALIVAAAGNQGWDHDEAGTQVFPAAFRLENVLAVAAYDNRDQLWEKSNFGAHSVHLGAPGVSIFGPVIGGYGHGTGTSFAAPFVSATLAALATRTSLSQLALKERLLQTTAVIDYYEKNRTVTAGRLHLKNALTDTRPPRPLSPTDWQERPLELATPHPYPAGFKQSYHLKHPGAKRLRVHFNQFKTEKVFDRVRLRDGAGRVVIEYSGQRYGWSAEVLGEEMWIDFRADAVTEDFGFEIDRYQFSEQAWEQKKSSPFGGAFLSPSLWFPAIFISGFSSQVGRDYVPTPSYP